MRQIEPTLQHLIGYGNANNTFNQAVITGCFCVVGGGGAEPITLKFLLFCNENLSWYLDLKIIYI